MLQTPSQIVEVNGSRFLFGLTWQPLSRDNADIAIVRIFAEREKAVSLVLHKERENSCLGLSLCEEIGIPSAASAAARAKKGSWIAVIKLSAGRYWLVGAHRGEVVPGTDIVFGSGQDAFAEVEVLKQLISFDETFVAEGVLDDDPLPTLAVEDVVMAGKGTTNMSPTQSFGDALKSFVTEHKKLLVGVVAGLVIVAVAGNTLLDHLAEEKEKAERAEQQASDDQKDKDKRKEVAKRRKTVEGNWTAQMLPSAYISECRTGINLLSLPVAGWVRERRSCNAQVAVSFSRDWGSDTRLAQLAIKRNASVLNKGTDRPVLSKTLPSGLRSRRELLPNKDVETAFLPIVRSLKAKADILAEKKVDGGVFEDARYYKREVRISDVADIKALGAALDAIPGVVIKSLSKTQSALWNANLEIYYVQVN